MEKVITLLKDLAGKVEAEGKEEAANYDKYACFCKEQASDKLYAIEKSEKRIADLKAEIEKLNAEIAELNKEIAFLAKKISDLEDEIDKKTKIREKEHAEYLVKAQDLDEAISACARAIEALEESKLNVKEGGGKVSQLIQLTKDVVQVISKHPDLTQHPSAVALLSKINQPGGPAKFQYQSNDIIATLQDLLAQFKKMKKELDVEEFDINAAFESERLGLQNQKKFAEKDKAEKEVIEQAKQERLNQATTEKDEEIDDMNADQNFLDVITNDCQVKAQEFDQRSQTRAGELKAIAEAIAALEKGAVPNWEANKRLVHEEMSTAGRIEVAKASGEAAAFVQIKSVQKHRLSTKEALLGKLHSYLDGLAEQYPKMKALSALAVRVKVQEDHFVKVRQLIQDLIDKLEADAKAEAEQKSFCDKNMAKAINDRDEANAKIEAADAKITTETARKNLLEDEINRLNNEIAELKKALLEATELRAEEKAENEKTIAMANEGAQYTKIALEILSKFYESAKLLQMKKYVPPNSDREGNTVGDLAPEVFSGKYHGAQAEGGGIIGILEVILSDFDRTVEKTTEYEAESQEAFEEFERDTNADIDKKDKRIKDAEIELADAKQKILEGEQEMKDGKDLLTNAEDALDALKPLCVEGEETWEERTAARMKEVEGLKAALAILEDWQGPAAENSLDDAPDREQI
jgi:predicted  nucleic acid-binding Zn-ribbon protein